MVRVSLDLVTPTNICLALCLFKQRIITKLQKVFDVMNHTICEGELRRTQKRQNGKRQRQETEEETEEDLQGQKQRQHIPRERERANDTGKNT